MYIVQDYKILREILCFGIGPTSNFGLQATYLSFVSVVTRNQLCDDYFIIYIYKLNDC
jgi:hypothetical protein